MALEPTDRVLAKTAVDMALEAVRMWLNDKYTEERASTLLAFLVIFASHGNLSIAKGMEKLILEMSEEAEAVAKGAAVPTDTPQPTLPDAPHDWVD